MEGWNVQAKWNVMNISHRQQVEEAFSQQQQNRNWLQKCNSILCVCVQFVNLQLSCEIWLAYTVLTRTDFLGV
jgi:hypothetical protein